MCLYGAYICVYVYIRICMCVWCVCFKCRVTQSNRNAVCKADALFLNGETISRSHMDFYTV